MLPCECLAPPRWSSVDAGSRSVKEPDIDTAAPVPTETMAAVRCLHSDTIDVVAAGVDCRLTEAAPDTHTAALVNRQQWWRTVAMK